MYLSLLMLSPRSRQVQRELANPYEMHRTIMQAFPNGVKREASSVLFRLDTDSHTGELMLLVQSQTEPNWHVLKMGFLCDGDAPQVKTFNLAMRANQLLAFRLRANPTKRVGNKSDVDYGKRVALYKEEDQLNWLARKGTEHGFRVLQVRVSRAGIEEGQIRRSDRSHDLTLFSVLYDGVLQVIDPVRLRETVISGVGSGKAFGFGLLSLAKPD